MRMLNKDERGKERNRRISKEKKHIVESKQGRVKELVLKGEKTDVRRGRKKERKQVKRRKERNVRKQR
jgi:hypothetical protein